ncbi:hypothetical protein BSR29_00040 [Boudabousia liubingyangii]|uniref:Long-chain fatty acid--CoA ligase n=1 Tax=Boudabousia liubingyangii TaxID=1921764 RepID=A0A1Q5PPC3_9ACTO|nr:AMP-binding protein [Boudabousia liubingyangii]OKL49404.1 hypothetical protein BSR29_00040 [Boudabousia liubingyangii]
MTVLAANILNPARTLARAAARHPERPSLVELTRGLVGVRRTWTVPQALTDTQKLAHYLQAECGIEAGGRVMVCAHNSAWHMLTYTATALLNATIIPINWRLTTGEIRSLAQHAQAQVLLCDSERETELREILDASQTHPIVIGLSDLEARIDSYEYQLSVNSDNYPEVTNGGFEAAIIFTSGTTDTPKAVALTQQQLWWGWQNFRHSFEYGNHDTGMAVAPFSHIGGFNGTTNDLYSNGGTLIIAPDFHPANLLSALAKYRVSIMFAVPTMYDAMRRQENWNTVNLDNFQCPLIGGSAPTVELMTALHHKGLHPINVYGMTETAGAGICASPEIATSHPGSVGHPFPWVDARVLDAENPDPNHEVPEGTPGMLAVRGPGVVTQYLNNAAPESFIDGWLLTGDMVTRVDGVFTIVGRKADTIISGGENIHPLEIENSLADYPALNGALITATPDQHWGELITLLAVPADPSTPPTLKEIQAYLDGKIARFKLPRRLILVEQIPLNANGKPDRSAARELAK